MKTNQFTSQKQQQQQKTISNTKALEHRLNVEFS